MTDREHESLIRASKEYLVWLSDYAAMLMERVCCTEGSRADRRAAQQRVTEIKAYLALPAVGSAQLIQRVNAARERKEISDNLHADLIHTLASSMGPAPETNEPVYRKWPGEPPHCMSCDCGMTDEQKRTVPEADYLRIHKELMDLKFPGTAGTALKPSESPSRSVQRRVASQKGEPAPEFGPEVRTAK